MLSIEVAVYNDGTQLVTQTISSTEICVFLTIFLASFFAVQSGRQTNVGKLKGRSPPGPRGFPLLGHLPLLGTKPFAQMTKWADTFGGVYKIRMGSRDTIILNGLESIRSALLKQSAAFAGRPDFESFLNACGGYSIGFANYSPRWRQQKKIAQTALHTLVTSSSDPVEDVINEQAKDMTDGILKTAGQAADPYSVIREATAGVVFSLCFGRHNRPNKNEASKQLLDILKAFENAHKEANIVDLMPWTKRLMEKQVGKLVDVLESLTALTDRKAQEHQLDYDPQRIRDAMDAYIKAGEEITEETTRTTGLTKRQLLHSVQDIIAAGTDSMSRTMQWTVMYMAKYPHIQERVFAEIEDRVGTERQPALSDRDSLPYTTACLYEVARHATVVPLGLPHATTTDTQLDDIFIPEGTLVFPNYHSVNHDQELWTDPENFRPERFLSEDELSLDSVKTEQVALFGLGKRRCLGEELGKLEMFLFFTNLLQRCRFVKPDDQELDLNDGVFVFSWQPKPFKTLVYPRSSA